MYIFISIRKSLLLTTAICWVGVINSHHRLLLRINGLIDVADVLLTSERLHK